MDWDSLFRRKPHQGSDLHTQDERIIFLSKERSRILEEWTLNLEETDPARDASHVTDENVTYLDALRRLPLAGAVPSLRAIRRGKHSVRFG
jgi:hypothetical protein